MIRGKPLLYLSLIGAALVCMETATARGQGRNTRVAAHRGGALLWPENSLMAFEQAIKLGADYLECDVHLTQDGEVVVIHDATLDRTTTGSGAVEALPLAAVQRLQVRAGPSLPPIPQPPPTLAELLALINGRVQLLLEVKGSPQGRYTGIEEKILSLLQAHRMLDHTLVMSFDMGYLARLRQLHPTIRLGGLRSVRQVLEGKTVAALQDEVIAIQGEFIGLHHRLITPEIVAAAHQRTLHMGAWTVNDEAAMRRMLRLGVDILISDRPDVALELVKVASP